MALSFAETYDATPSSVALVRNRMAGLARDCGLDALGVDGVKLAVSEAATNALVHGYRDGPGSIRVEASTGGGELQIAVHDDGGGMRTRTDSPGMGLGLPLIASLTRRLEVLDGDPGTELRMTFDCPRASAPRDRVLASAG